MSVLSLQDDVVVFEHSHDVFVAKYVRYGLYLSRSHFIARTFKFEWPIHYGYEIESTLRGIVDSLLNEWMDRGWRIGHCIH